MLHASNVVMAILWFHVADRKHIIFMVILILAI